MYEDLKDDEFIDIPGYEGYYQINKLGEVRSLDRWCNHYKSGKCLKRSRILAKSKDDRGYYFINLCINYKRNSIKLHRLMAEMFIPNPYNKPQVNHINGIKTDISLSNLEWATESENMKHAFANGLNKPKYGKDCNFFGMGGERNYNVINRGINSSSSKIILNTQTGIFYFGAEDAAKSIGTSKNTLRMKLNGIRKNNTSLIYT